ncbi:Anticodon-binding domain containing protein [Aphelenchoides avenae]|nr:Anticodon-binding domain containing protein [Aphelenchus avenae]
MSEEQTDEINANNIKFDVNNLPSGTANFSIFTVGDIVECNTEQGPMTGQVVVHDRAMNVLVLRDETGRKPQLLFINMSHVQNVVKKDSAPVTYTVKPTPDYEKAQLRLNKATEEKKGIWVDNISAEAREAFVMLKKMFNDVEWDGKNIKVLKRVLVKEPFTAMNTEPVDGKPQSTEALKQVRKVFATMKLKEKENEKTQTKPRSQ